MATIETSADLLVVHVVSTKVKVYCPLCFCLAKRRHSRYTRVVADLPCAGFHVQLRLQMRKFFCDNAHCSRKIFTERVPTFIEPWAQTTVRLRQALQALGTATCGELGTRLATHLGIRISAATILRRIMALPSAPVKAVSHLGIDDFALRRGRNYGTILVDLQRHQVIDLLPDRKAETAKAWIRAHPEIKLVSRDRAGDYATAARQGAPQAVQTADRFHLVKNLAEAVEKALAHCRAELQKDPKEQRVAKAEVPEEPLLSLLTSNGQVYSAHQTERYERYQHVMALHKQGMKVKEIAKRVGLGARTVQRWLTSDDYPETQYHTRRHRSRFDAYAAYVQQRWDEGCHNIQQLWREIKAQGYPHSDRALRAHLEPLHGQRKAAFPAASSLDRFSAKEATWLFIRPLKDLDKKEQQELATIRRASKTAETIYQLVQAFLQIVRTRQGEHLDSWMNTVRACHIRELNSFVSGLERDQAAVLAGLTLPYSNGQTEGHITKLKLIKRMMYGRAGFPLLRQRMLHCA
ncbi:transposase [Ktedonobacteria bacterium brp13]|nr:transposase [Ktedonobacteria bacterium brp13]